MFTFSNNDNPVATYAASKNQNPNLVMDFEIKEQKRNQNVNESINNLRKSI